MDRAAIVPCGRTVMQQVLDETIAPPRDSAWATLLADPWIGWAVFTSIAIRLVQLDAAPMWFDEAVTAQWTGLPWGEMIRRVVADYHPPLYFVLLKAWSELAGISPWALRLPSALLSWLIVPLIAATGATLMGRTAGRWAAWLAALSPFLLHHGQEARMYALVAALAATNLLLLSRFATGASRSLGWTFVISAAALVASHYYGVFFLGGELVVLLIIQRKPLRSWLPAAIATAGALLIALVAAVVLPTHRPVSEYALGWFAFPGVVWSMLAGYTLLPGSDNLHLLGWHAALPYVPLAAVGGVALAVTCAVGL
jgi:4-amino-4-deoxy-L-arabinose transferase-like glycosyltransferase